jgi:hypothetical protein
VLPFYRGVGARAGDRITQRLEAAGISAIEPPNDVPAGVTEGVPITLTMREKRIFQEASGKALRRLLQENNVQEFTPQALDRLRSSARQAGVAAALASLGPGERERRVRAALGRKGG